MACEISQMCGGIKGVGWSVVDCGVWWTVECGENLEGNG